MKTELVVPEDLVVSVSSLHSTPLSLSLVLPSWGFPPSLNLSLSPPPVSLFLELSLSLPLPNLSPQSLSLSPIETKKAGHKSPPRPGEYVLL